MPPVSPMLLMLLSFTKIFIPYLLDIIILYFSMLLMLLSFTKIFIPYLLDIIILYFSMLLMLLSFTKLFIPTAYHYIIFSYVVDVTEFSKDIHTYWISLYYIYIVPLVN